MDEENTLYVSPLSSRYASEEMQRLFSETYRITTFRKLWVMLAKEEKKLGLSITDEQIQELETHVDTLNLAVAREKEKEIRHDVMAQI